MLITIYGHNRNHQRKILAQKGFLPLISRINCIQNFIALSYYFPDLLQQIENFRRFFTPPLDSEFILDRVPISTVLGLTSSIYYTLIIQKNVISIKLTICAFPPPNKWLYLELTALFANF